MIMCSCLTDKNKDDGMAVSECGDGLRGRGFNVTSTKWILLSHLKFAYIS